MGKVDEDGYFFIVDRKKDLIIRGGYNVYPREIEEVLYEHAGGRRGRGDRRARRRAGRGGRRRGRAQGRRGGRARTTCATTSRSEVAATSTRARSGSSTSCPRARPARSSSARSRCPSRSRPERGTTEASRAASLASTAHRRGAAGWTRCSPTRPSARCGRLLPGVAGVKAAAKLATRPDGSSRGGAGLAGRAGEDRRRPLRGRRRTRATAASRTRRGQATRPSAGSARPTSRPARRIDGLVADADLDWGDEQRMRFIVDNLVEALGAEQHPVPQPRGAQGDDRHRRRQPRQGRAPVRARLRRAARASRRWSTPTRSRSARTSRSRPGAVVLRTDVFELIQYTPQTQQGARAPLLIVPPTINKYYVIDLRRTRSLVEHLVSGGQQVFAISWRNPDERHADWGLDTYGQAILEALDAVEKITAEDAGRRCSASAPAASRLALAAAHLAADRRPRPASPASARRVRARPGAGRDWRARCRSATSPRLAVAESARKGYLDGRALAEVFAWLRPNDLIWNYWVNNYLLGKDAAGVRHPVLERRHHAHDRRRCTATSSSSRWTTRSPSRAESRCSAPRSTSARSTADTYVVAGIADHIVPVADLLPDHPAARRRAALRALHQRPHRGDGQPARQREGELPDRNEQPAEPRTSGSSPRPSRGTWWDDYVEWLGERSGEREAGAQDARRRGYKPLEKAPGKYVLTEAGD